ncbi:MAG: MFS transporter [Ignavibacteria bacterium]|nr:MFS transporter [Ignavibacteria bacterium]MBT8383674.1 MFS transporter [Ignavibacteria bacterium]MBT8391702.1 MFS transporter [Ignavibacteria bacterium]NNJ54244.1 MFS transporter [Ignavibacteriaceae bacterium]NNL22743.1 MFS transporter [Ignavibacteriaceae bacterium]
MKNKSALPLIFLTVFIDLLGFGILIPILPAFAVKQLGVDEAAIGIAIAVYSFVQFIFNPILGKLSDKHGRKPIIVVCLFINALGYIIFAFTTSYLILIASRVVAGIGGSSISVAQAYIADVTTKETRSKGMGLIGSAFGLGFVFGPLIGGFLSKFGYMETGLGAAAFSLLAFLVTLILLPESNVNRTEIVETKRKILNIDAIVKAFKNPNLAILISLFFILTFSFANIYGTFALLGIEVYGFSDLQNGYMFGIVGLSSAMVQGGLIGPITKFLGKKKILIIGSALIMITLALIPYAGNFLWLAVVGIFLSLGTGMLQPTLLSLISEVASDAEQGITLGVNQSLSALARMLGPLWGGFAFEFLGYPLPFLTGSAFMLLIVIATIFYIPKRINFQ